ncbi:hypothetical protein GCM10011350_34630 [Marinomonas arctica]|nr:hypothetical protein GCM10011350_34630 [Marinomonas arctica]
MRSERSAYLEAAQSGNKANGYRPIICMDSVSDSLGLQIPIDCLSLFETRLLDTNYCIMNVLLTLICIKIA